MLELLIVWCLVSIPFALFIGCVMGFSSEGESEIVQETKQTFAKGGIVDSGTIYLIGGGAVDSGKLYHSENWIHNNSKEQL